MIQEGIMTEEWILIGPLCWAKGNDIIQVTPGGIFAYHGDAMDWLGPYERMRDAMKEMEK